MGVENARSLKPHMEWPPTQRRETAEIGTNKPSHIRAAQIARRKRIVSDPVEEERREEE